MIFLSAGHHLKDPGASGSGFVERDLTIELRDLIVKHLQRLGARFVLDKDTETLQQYLDRIQTGSGSVVCELHFNAAGPTAKGTEVVVPDDSTPAERDLAAALCALGQNALGLHNRGVIPEAKTARKRLAIMRESGINVLIEVCFISNPADMTKYEEGKELYAAGIAEQLKKFDDLIV